MLKLAVVNVPDVLRVPWPRLVAPSKKVTVPAGLPAPLGVTVAVKTTLWPNTDGLTEEPTAVVVVRVVTVLTVWVIVPLLVRKLVSPA